MISSTYKCCTKKLVLATKMIHLAMEIYVVLNNIFTNDMIISDSAAIAFMHTAMCNVGRATTYKR